MVQSETLPRMTLDGRIGALTMLGNRLVYPVPGNNKTTLPRFFYIHTRLSLLRWFPQRALELKSNITSLSLVSF